MLRYNAGAAAVSNIGEKNCSNRKGSNGAFSHTTFAFEFDQSPIPLNFSKVPLYSILALIN